MAGHARYTATLDACVLFPIVTADVLMTLAGAGLFAAKWTARIEDEWMSNLAKARPDIAAKLGLRRDDMRDAVPDWEVSQEAWERLVDCIELPDPDDRHVLAAAIAGHADCIVTANLKHFPADLVGLFGIEVIHPDDFIIQQWDLDPFTVIRAFREMRLRKKKPPIGVQDLAAAMRRSSLFSTSDRLLTVADFA